MFTGYWHVVYLIRTEELPTQAALQIFPGTSSFFINCHVLECIWSNFFSVTFFVLQFLVHFLKTSYSHGSLQCLTSLSLMQLTVGSITLSKTLLYLHAFTLPVSAVFNAPVTCLPFTVLSFTSLPLLQSWKGHSVSYDLLNLHAYTQLPHIMTVQYTFHCCPVLCCSSILSRKVIQNTEKYLQVN